MRQALGELLAGQRALSDKIDHNDTKAEKYWDAIQAEIRNVKHDQRDLQQAQEGLTRATVRMGDKLDTLENLPATVNVRIEKLETKLNAIEEFSSRLKWLSRAAWSVIVALGSLLAFVAVHWGGTLLKWAFGKI